ncbi:MAG: DUF2971 domain-containing protein [Bacteroidales bacterium]|nr:DUF2971 domain-containing protein [Bacteroidales bacterium]
MTDFEKFAECLWEYWQASSPENKDAEAFKSFISKIKDLKCNDFRWFYFMAFYHNHNEEPYKAYDYIKKSLALLQEANYNVTEIRENNVLVFHKNNNKYFPILGMSALDMKGKIYMCAGEIAAKNDKPQESLSYYQTAQYLKSFLKSDFENQEFVKLYTYRPISQYSIADIVNDEITVTSPKLMNDPFDSVFTLWASEENFKKICSEPKHVPFLVESFNSFRIRSFTRARNCNSILMWSHYADEHKGICLKYRLSPHFIKQKETENNVHMYLKNISYLNKNVSLDVKSLNSNLAFATKKCDWKYEKEVRLISYNPNVVGDYLSIPLDPDSYIETVYFGYRCDDATVRMIRNLFQNKKHPPKFKKMELNPNDIYKLTPVDY